jgi:hypothetical protein
MVSTTLRLSGFAIRHADTNQPCTLQVIDDGSGGTFVLESAVSKERFVTNNDLGAFLPLKVMAHEYGDYLNE